MKINKNNTEDLDKIGVYIIKNDATNKWYVGSTQQSFYIRYTQHKYELLKNCHKNPHLQNAWNKYGEESFSFEILEICNNKEDCFIKEQYYLDMYKTYDSEKGYNINTLASGTGGMPTYIIKKRAKTFKKTMQFAMDYYYKVKNNEIALLDVPEKYVKIISFYLKNVPWNKGLTKEDINYDHLKVPKNNSSEKYKKGRESARKKVLSRSKKVIVYNYKGEYYNTFDCINSLIEYSKQEENTLPIILRTLRKNGKLLNFSNINNVCNGHAKHTKGLIIRYENSNLLVSPLLPSDIHPKWTKFKI